MPMMRRGPLDRYSAEWVLRQASAHGAEGSIEFHSDHPATLWFAGGRAYAAEDGVNLTEGDLAARPILTEDEARDRAVSLLTEVMGADSGWYFHDPLGQHPSRGSWAWETATLLMDTRAKAHEDRSTTTWLERTVVLDDARGERVTLGADAWAVLDELRERAGRRPINPPVARLLSSDSSRASTVKSSPFSARARAPSALARRFAAAMRPSTTATNSSSARSTNVKNACSGKSVNRIQQT